jgi:hypothetical protein
LLVADQGGIAESFPMHVDEDARVGGFQSVTEANASELRRARGLIHG